MYLSQSSTGIVVNPTVPPVPPPLFHVDQTLGNDANDGSIVNPFKSVAKVNGLTVLPGESVLFKRGESWSEDLSHTDSGTAGKPITFGAYGTGVRPVIRSGLIEGNYKTWEDIDADGEKTAVRGLRMRNGTNHIIRRSEIFNCTRDGLDLLNLTTVHVEDLHIHHCLRGTFGSEEDAHGIVGDNVQNLTSGGTINIHQVSGDCIQFDPARNGSDNIDFSGSINTWWTEPLSENFNAGWDTGDSPGENAVDTKVLTATRMSMTIGNLTAFGFTDIAEISNRAALNIKEGTDFVLDGFTGYDNENCFRIRKTTGVNAGNPDITIMNAEMWDSDKAFRVEDNLDDLKVYNCTLGSGITTFLQEAGGGIGIGEDLRNNSFLGAVPAAFSDVTNVQTVAGDFVDEAINDYRILDIANDLIDTGATIAVVTQDRLGISRNVPYEIGSYEGFIAAGGAHAYFELLQARSDHHFSIGLRDFDSEIEPNINASNPDNRKVPPTYDAVEDACRWVTDGATISSKDQIRLTWAGIGAGDLLITWEARWETPANDYDANIAGSQPLKTIKTFQINNSSGSSNRLIETRGRWSKHENPTGIAATDIRVYVIGGGTSGVGGEDALTTQIAEFQPAVDVWTRFFAYMNHSTGGFEYWVADETRSPVKLFDLTFSSYPGSFDGMWFELNSSQADSGVPINFWARNVVVLKDLTEDPQDIVDLVTF